MSLIKNIDIMCTKFHNRTYYKIKQNIINNLLILFSLARKVNKQYFSYQERLREWLYDTSATTV